MTKTIRALGFLALLALVCQPAQAQTPSDPETNLFATISVGTGLGTRTFGDTTNFVLYDEAASVSASQKVGHGLLFDIGGGYRVWRKLSIGLGLWTFHSSGDGTLSATIPSPIVFNSPVTFNLPAKSLSQTDVGINIQAVWTTSITDKIEAAIFIGPSIIHVKQDIGSVNVPAGTQTATAAIDTQSATTGKAGNAGIDLRYRLNDRYSAGLFVRYAGGQVDLPSAQKLKVGGAQVGLGLRARF